MSFLFSLKWDLESLSIKILGIKFRIRNKRGLQPLEALKSRIFYDELYALFDKNTLQLPDPDSHETAVTSLLWDNMKFLYPNLQLEDFKNMTRIPDFAIVWGAGDSLGCDKVVETATKLNIPLYIMEDGFLKSADTWCNYKTDIKYRNGVSFTIDSKAPYFDATRASLLERMLNDKSLIINDEQKLRARKLINKIVECKLTKYNHQPIFVPKIGRPGVKKVLVVDQSYGDMSILKGRANDKTFADMLQAAIDENPDADIIVKTHPDTMTGNRGGYYSCLKEHDNIYKQTSPINPISLIQYADKVYVVSTQLGFEALMCGKKVNVFGMPFYAGWGLTNDRQSCKRRTNQRTLEEVFYISYILYTHWVNPETEKRCEIEEAIDYLLKLRKEYCNV